jgi:phosphonate transport system substrate-binding protein
MAKLHINFKDPRVVCLLLAVALITSSVPAYAEPRQKEIKIGLVPEINIFKQVKRYKHLESYLTVKTGIKINFSVMHTYGDIIDMFYGRELDGAFFGSLTATLANIKLEIEPIARPVYMDGRSTNRSYMVVRKDSEIKGFRDLKGKVIVFVDKASTTGYIFPLAYLNEKGVKNVHTYFREYFYSGSHDAAVKGVLMKEADVGVVKNTVYESLSRKNPRIGSELMVIAESIEFPSDGLWLSMHVERDIRVKFEKALLNMDKDVEGKKVLRKFKAKRFVETTIDDYNGVFTILKKTIIKYFNKYHFYSQ